MKRIVFTLIILAAFAGNGMAQEKLKIGEMVDGRLKITHEADLRGFLMHHLNKSGTLGKEIFTEISPNADRILAWLKVNGNRDGVTTAGVMLVNMNNQAYIVARPDDQPPIGPGAGGSITYTCTGDPCTNCDIKITWPAGSWTPQVECICKDQGGGTCNMTVSFTVSVKIGLI